MIENNIIQSLGAGSGIDTTSLVSQLVAVERAAPQERIDSRREETETQISDFGLVKSALATLQDSANSLTDPEGLFSKSASFTESDALVPTELDTDVAAGVYAFTVEQIASSHSLAFDGFADPTASVGTAGDTITFNFGAWTRTAAPDNTPTSFTQDADSTSQTITIDSSNNSLEGLRDAINNGNFGVSANIVFDGTDYHLTLLAESGNDNQLEITVSETGGSPTNTDANGLSRFAFNASKTGFDSLETQIGQDALITLNGLQVARSSNVVSDIVDGLTLDVLKVSSETVTITVTEDTAFAEQNIRNFVDSYNAFLEAVDPAFGINEVENEDGETETIVGSLANDSLGKSILSQIRSLIATPVTGLADSNFTSLTNVGIRTELDGTLSIDETDFANAFENNFEDIQKLFAPRTVSSDTNVTVNSFGEDTTPGEYSVNITAPPSKGDYTGTVAATGFPLDTTGKTYTFDITVDGNTSATLTVPTATYATQSDLADALQSLINSDTTLSDAGSRVTVTVDSGAFVITSDRFGTGSNVSFSAVSTDLETDLGLSTTTGTSTAGVTVSGTIDSVAAFGSANVLLPDLDEPGVGLALIIGENATSATVNFSRGFAGELDKLIEAFLETDGVIATREATLNDSLTSLDDDQENLDRRIDAFEERLIQQYIAMERILSSLNSSGSFLDNLINTLPFTANNDN